MQVASEGRGVGLWGPDLGSQKRRTSFFFLFSFPFLVGSCSGRLLFWSAPVLVGFCSGRLLFWSASVLSGGKQIQTALFLPVFAPVRGRRWRWRGYLRLSPLDSARLPKPHPHGGDPAPQRPCFLWRRSVGHGSFEDHLHTTSSSAYVHRTWPAQSERTRVHSPRGASAYLCAGSSRWLRRSPPPARQKPAWQARK